MRSEIFIVFILFLCSSAYSQVVELHDSELDSVEHAQYLSGDITKILNAEINYAASALESKIEGDVVLSFIIDKNGKMGNLTIVSSPHKSLSTSSILSMNSLENNWSPYKVNNQPLDKKYLMVFRYRIYLNTQPPAYKKEAERLFKKQKYERALKHYNWAIEENKYDADLFEGRSLVKDKLSDTEGAKQDKETYKVLKNEVFRCIDVVSIGITKKVTKTTVIRR